MPNLVPWKQSLFYFMTDIGRKVCSNDKEWSFFSIFIPLGFYPQVFGQVKEWLIVELREIIRVPHIVACPMNFNLLCDRGQ